MEQHDATDQEEQEQMELFNWIDGIPLSRRKKHIEKDFCDGVLVAEIVNFKLPGLVDMHNYSAANKFESKKANWLYLNRNVFRKLGFELSEKEIKGVADSQPGAIQNVLKKVRAKIDRCESNRTLSIRKQDTDRKYESEKPEVDQHVVLSEKGKLGKGKKGNAKSQGSNQTNLRIAYEEKVQECLLQDEKIQILASKVSRLEHLTQIKDKKIDELQARVEALRPTGIRRYIEYDN